MTEGENPIHDFTDKRIKKRYRKEAQQGARRFVRAAKSMPSDCTTGGDVDPITVALTHQQVAVLNDKVTPDAVNAFRSTLNTVRDSECKWGKKGSFIYEGDKLLKLEQQGENGNHRSDMMTKCVPPSKHRIPSYLTNGA